MEDDLVSPAEVEAQVSASAGEPDVSRPEVFGGRGDAGEGRDGDQVRSQEDQARALLEGCDGLEPPYEYMSVEGTTEHPEEQGADEPATESPEAIRDGSSRRSPSESVSPVVNGVGSARGCDDRRRVDGPSEADQRCGSSSLLNMEVEDLVKQLLAQNQALTEELAYVRQESARTTESEGLGLYRSRDEGSVGVKIGSEVVGEGRGSRGVKAPREGFFDRGKGRGASSSEPEYAGRSREHVRMFYPPWTQIAPSQPTGASAYCPGQDSTSQGSSNPAGPFNPQANTPFRQVPMWEQQELQDRVAAFSLSHQGFAGQAANQMHQGFAGQAADQVHQGFAGQAANQVHQGFAGQAANQVHQGCAGQAANQVHQGFEGQVANQVHQGFEGQVANQVHQGFAGQAANQMHQDFAGQAADQVHQGFAGQAANQVHQGFAGQAANQVHQGFAGQAADQVHQGVAGQAANEVHQGFAGQVTSQANQAVAGRDPSLSYPSTIGPDEHVVCHEQSGPSSSRLRTGVV